MTDRDISKVRKALFNSLFFKQEKQKKKQDQETAKGTRTSVHSYKYLEYTNPMSNQHDVFQATIQAMYLPSQGVWVTG